MRLTRAFLTFSADFETSCPVRYNCSQSCRSGLFVTFYKPFFFRPKYTASYGFFFFFFIAVLMRTVRDQWAVTIAARVLPGNRRVTTVVRAQTLNARRLLVRSARGSRWRVDYTRNEKRGTDGKIQCRIPPVVFRSNKQPTRNDVVRVASPPLFVRKQYDFEIVRIASQKISQSFVRIECRYFLIYQSRSKGVVFFIRY